MNFDIDLQLVHDQVRQRSGRDAELVALPMDGAPATDVERVVRSLGSHPGALLVYLTAARDYPHPTQLDPCSTPLSGILFVPDAEPLRCGNRVNGYLRELLGRYVGLYRYRVFLRQRFVWELRRCSRAFIRRPTAPRNQIRRGQTPEDSDRQQSFADFRGAAPVSLDLYVSWLDRVKENPARYLASQKAITGANYGLAGNDQISGLKRLLQSATVGGMSPVLIYPPVNPLIVNGGTEYYDPALADSYAAFFRSMSQSFRGTMLDWRNGHDIDEFVDFNHLNHLGRRTLSLQLADYLVSVFDQPRTAAADAVR